MEITPVRAAVIAGCAYEIIAVSTGKLPTVSRICRKYRVAEIAFFAWLLVHLHRKTEDDIIAEVKKINRRAKDVCV